MSNRCGCFADYLDLVKYLSNNTNVSEIILGLSPHIECSYYSYALTPDSISPAIWYNNGYIPEIWRFLTADIKLSSKVCWTNVEKNANNGTHEVYEEYTPYEKMYENANSTSSPLFSLDDNKFDQSILDKNIEALKQIKMICDEKGITLSVFCGPYFVNALATLECEQYYDYLKGIASVVDFWDFSKMSDYALNAYNFWDEYHFTTVVGNRLIDIMHGNLDIDYGTLVTVKNVDTYIQERRDAITHYNEIWEENGMYPIFDRNHYSYLGEMRE